MVKERAGQRGGVLRGDAGLMDPVPAACASPSSQKRGQQAHLLAGTMQQVIDHMACLGVEEERASPETT